MTDEELQKITADFDKDYSQFGAMETVKGYAQRLLYLQDNWDRFITIIDNATAEQKTKLLGKSLAFRNLCVIYEVLSRPQTSDAESKDHHR